MRVLLNEGLQNLAHLIQYHLCGKNVVGLCGVNTLSNDCNLGPLSCSPWSACLDISDPTITHSPPLSRFNVTFQLKQLHTAIVPYVRVNLEPADQFPLRMVRCVDFCLTNKQVDSINTELESL